MKNYLSEFKACMVLKSESLFQWILISGTLYILKKKNTHWFVKKSHGICDMELVIVPAQRG